MPEFVFQLFLCTFLKTNMDYGAVTGAGPMWQLRADVTLRLRNPDVKRYQALKYTAFNFKAIPVPYFEPVLRIHCEYFIFTGPLVWLGLGLGLGVEVGVGARARNFKN